MLETTHYKYAHLINTDINKWHVLDIVEHQIKDRFYLFAKCRCHCGTVRDIRLSTLLSNKYHDCGCGHRERLAQKTKQQYEHLIGTQINSWLCLDIIPPTEDQRNTYVLCQCKCGTIKEVRLSYLLNNRSKDCGCGRRKSLSATRTKNLVGQRFGKLTVLARLEKDCHNHTKYKCVCDCGNFVEVLGNSLTTAHTSSCGCLVSYWNTFIQQFLEKNKIEHKAEYTVYIGNSYYRYDFYLPQYNLFIEYDGEQHFKPVRFFGNEDDAKLVYKRTHESDLIKNRYCKQNGINLLRIPYWETKNIETIISNHLQRLSTRDPVE